MWRDGVRLFIRQVKVNSQLHTRIAVLEQQVTDKELISSNADGLLKAEMAQKVPQSRLKFYLISLTSNCYFSQK